MFAWQENGSFSKYQLAVVDFCRKGNPHLRSRLESVQTKGMPVTVTFSRELYSNDTHSGTWEAMSPPSLAMCRGKSERGKEPLSRSIHRFFKPERFGKVSSAVSKLRFETAPCLIHQAQKAQLPFRKMGTTRPSRVWASMFMESQPIMKSSWIMESLMP